MPAPARRLPAARWAVVGAVVVLIYAVTLVLYGSSGKGQGFGEDVSAPAGGVHVAIAVRDLDAAANVLSADVSVNPGEGLLASDEVTPTADLSVVIAPTAEPSELHFPRGEVPAVVPVRIVLDGDIESWPLDTYESLVVVQALQGSGDARTQIPATVSIQGHSNGWKTWAESPTASISEATSDVQVFTFRGKRSGGTLAFAVIMLCVLVAMPVLAGFVAYQTYRGRRRVEPAFTSWIAAMLFATVPLRNFLPGAPPAGSWIDATITLWVVVALVGSLGLYVAAWWQRGPRAGP